MGLKHGHTKVNLEMIKYQEWGYLDGIKICNIKVNGKTANCLDMDF